MTKKITVPGLLITLFAIGPVGWGNESPALHDPLTAEISIATGFATRQGENDPASVSDSKEFETSAGESIDCFYAWNASHPACLPSAEGKR